MRGWLINDQRGVLGGSYPIYDRLLEWIPDLEWAGDMEFARMAAHIEGRLNALDRPDQPDYLIRNASFFRRLQLPRPIPRCAFLQDISWTAIRWEQKRVIDDATLTVFPTPFAQGNYLDCNLENSLVIPIGVDAEFWHPVEDDNPFQITPGSILWVGGLFDVKNWMLLAEVIASTDYQFVIVLKDLALGRLPDSPRVRVLESLTSCELRSVMQQCAVLLCTSTHETQHLAGIEFGMATGRPIVSSSVGCYWQRPAGAWGEAVPPHDLVWDYRGTVPRVEDLVEALRRHYGKPGEASVREAWATEFAVATCRERWLDVVGRLDRARV